MLQNMYTRVLITNGTHMKAKDYFPYMIYFTCYLQFTLIYLDNFIYIE